MTKLRTKIFQIELEFSEQYYNLDILTEKKVMEILMNKNICNNRTTFCKGKILTSGIMEEEV